MAPHGAQPVVGGAHYAVVALEQANSHRGLREQGLQQVALALGGVTRVGFAGLALAQGLRLGGRQRVAGVEKADDQQRALPPGHQVKVAVEAVVLKIERLALGLPQQESVAVKGENTGRFGHRKAR
jgi:hypothetical protein